MTNKPMDIDARPHPLAERIAAAESAAASSSGPSQRDKVGKAAELYRSAVLADQSELDDLGFDPLETYKLQEAAILALARLYVRNEMGEDLRRLLEDIRPFFATLPKARTAKIVRTLIDDVTKMPGHAELAILLCKDCINWCRVEKRTFLRLRVEKDLAALYFQQGRYQLGLNLTYSLSKEVKKLDDKLLLVEIHLTESKLHFSIQNMPKAKAALTAARTNANGIHCPPLIQAEIDLQSGVLHAQEKDYKTSFSYFYESFEAFNVADDPRALTALKYQLLAKIMCNQSSEAQAIISGKNGLKYVGVDSDALLAVAKCHQQRSLNMFELVLSKYSDQLRNDPIIRHHINDLNETLTEQNILRILEPFSRVEISHVAKLMGLPLARVQSKLSEMILDKKLHGTLDQGVGVLILFDQEPLRNTYEDSLETIRNIGQCVDTLYEKAKILSN